VQVRCEDELELAAAKVEMPFVGVDEPDGYAKVVMFQKNLGPPVGDDACVITGNEVFDETEGACNVRVLVVADKVAYPGEGDYLLNLAERVLEGENRARVYEYGLVAMLDKVYVALELVIFEFVAYPPYARRYLCLLYTCPSP